MQNFGQHTVLITGGNSGIGAALVRAFHRAGSRVIATGRDPGRLGILARELPGLRIFPADLADPKDRERLIRDVTTLHPSLSLLINNAGVQHLADHVAARSPEETAAQRARAGEELATNIGAVVDLTLALLPVLRGAPESAIVFVSSGLALAPKKSAPVYCASKSFVHGFAKALRYQCEDSAPHLKIVEVLPPLVDTPMTAGRGRGKISPEQVAAETLAGLAAGRREVNVGKTKLLRAVQRLSPTLADRILRNW
jgi:uncharacterized oxidoreductase